MNATVGRSLIAFVPVSVLLIASIRTMTTRRGLGAIVQFFGACCFLLVVFAHICEGLGLFPQMAWGQQHSAGHYLDLACAILGLTLLPLGIGIRLVRRSAA